MDWLTISLLDLLYELQGSDIPIMIGGGFGIYLKRMHIEAIGERTLYGQLPYPRSTNDLDLFLHAEMLADLPRIKEVEQAIRRLGYNPVEEAKYMQWKRPIRIGEIDQGLKIDVLVGPIANELRPKLKMSSPRVRPKGAGIQFHAHIVEEAIRLEEDPVQVWVEGKRSNGEPYRAKVQVPHAFPYLMMKLHAFSDRKEDGNKDLGRHHAMDLYSITGMMIEAEYQRAVQLGVECAETEHVSRAREIVASDFSNETALGILRLKEHGLYRQDFVAGRFVDILKEIFML